jgi:predicted kinase
VDLDDAGGIVAFDCLEFDPALRWIDVVCDNAFLMMDLLARDAGGLAYDFASASAEATGDYEGVPLLPFYLVYRTLVRAKVAAITLEQHGGRDAAARAKLERHLRLAEEVVGRAEPAIILTNGVSGSGKTYVTTELIGELRAIRVRSDLERKRLFGLRETERSDGRDIYTEEASDAVFARLLAAARSVLAAGFPVIVDATFIRRERREPFARLASELGVPWAHVAVHAAPDLLRARVARRAAEGRDASEAGVAVLESQLAAVEPLDDAESARCVTVDSAVPVDVPDVVARLRALTC